MRAAEEPTAARADREIVSTRVFDAPRERVFLAFSDLGALARWWRPSGFTSTFQEFDFRPGGVEFGIVRRLDGRDGDPEA